ncbi:hypothetical protein ASPWEDRAFT_108896 [Aspergillus wentii DTO 134E9]|uniref:Zn(2)-C6 fungal-type domain-containing protein n=1 Tax=Aspergillus wentii DTO 134E9 TaxID=1073089 RepID=A0A1L9RNB8_ASPWE|nr:uncharacterized protein ASPWEDRAFT_108896 [Aspergillus wentii DTO 134E9]OJJ36435.1 hypothetical protein ASPWEDRAFT_108896 [Aspergillus wentii DTO 134E9]
MEARTRKRIPKSCRRCHRRKQRCVGFPSCTNCEAAHQPCVRSETALSWHHGMSKNALAHRIEALEAQLSALRDETSEVDGQHSPTDSHLNGVVRFLTLGHEGSVPGYLGPSSGLSVAENLNRIVHDAVSKSLPVNGGNQPGPWPNTEQKVAPPEDAIGEQILNAYFKNMHMRLPFLDRHEILELHAQRHQGAGPTPHDQFRKFKIFMVYAIGAAILQMTETYDSTPPNTFLATALQFEPTLRESLSIATIEAMMLLVLYNLRSSSNSSVWYMIGLAMRTCVDFGLHREAHYQKLKPEEGQLRRRLFWSVYLIERYVAWSLGRPFSIAEEEMDAELPPEIDEQGQPNLRRFISSIRLQRIMSQIHMRIYRVDKNISSLVPEISPLLASLEEYKRSLPRLDPHEDDFVHMHWNNSIRMLLQPFLNTLHPEDKLIQTCLSASGQMCQFFKRLRQRDSSGYSFLLVNSVFLAGLTMCFCLFRSPGLWTTSVSNDLRACSSALFVMAERNQNLKKYRDGLENIINRAMNFVSDNADQASSVQETPTIPTTNWNSALFDLQDPLFSTFHDFQPDSLLQTELQDPFNGMLTEDFWAGDGFSLHMDGQARRQE